MRNVLVAAAVLASMSGAALAADLPSRAAPVFAPPPPPVFTWSGGYLGVNAGYAFDYSSRFRTFDGVGVAGIAPAAVFRPEGANVHSDGFTAGGQFGYNYEFGGFGTGGVVIGFEADAAYTDTSKTNAYALGVPAANNILHSDMDFLGTVRGRLGYAFDRFMVFGTGGFAYGDVTNRARFYDPNGNLAYAGGRSDIQTGYAYGGGIEYAVPTDSFLSSLNFFHSSAVTIKAEYLHYDLGTVTMNVPAVNNGTNYTTRIRTDGDLARIGINYKF